MKSQVSYSGNSNVRGYGRKPYVSISLEPENDLEKAILRMAYSGERKVFIWDSGNAEIRVNMPRGKNP